MRYIGRCKHVGRQLQYNTVPFGLSTSGNWFTRMIHILLSGIESKFAVAYLDDILVFSETFEDHIVHLNEVFTRLSNAKLSLNRKKCHFVKPEVEYLGHIVSSEGIKPNPEKTRAIQTMDPPTTVNPIRHGRGLKTAPLCEKRKYFFGCNRI